MNTNWYKIVLFCVLSFLLGWFVGHHLCGGHHGCCEGDSGCHGKSMCEHGGGCCSEGGGHCDMEGCDHKMGGACCKGEGMEEGMHGGNAMGEGGGGHEARVHAIIDGLKEKNFQGDTTVKIEDGTVHISRHGDKMEVKVEMRDSLSIDKTVEVHSH